MNVIWSEEVDSIFSSGFFLGGVGVNNWALSRDEALRAIFDLEALGVPILGGDVYRVADGVVEPTYDNWYCDKEIKESNSEFLRRSISRARDYVSNYKAKGVKFAIVPKIQH